MTTRTEKNSEIQEEIFDEERKEKIKKLSLLILKIFLISLFFLSAIFLYTKYCSTKGLVVHEERIINESLPESFNGLKIIHFSDLHYGTTIFAEELTNVVELINERNPDIVVFTGDLIDKNYKISNKEQEALTKLLKRIKAPIGKYAVSGEEDNSDFTTIMNQSDFSVLNNNYDLIYSTDNTPVLLVGLGSSTQNTRDIDTAYRYFKEGGNSNIYTILLMHETDDIDEAVKKYRTDLALGGHSHNGQIKIPGIGPLIKKEGSIKYDDYYYDINGTKLYISSGIGSNGIGFRLFSRPSISFFRMSNK